MVGSFKSDVQAMNKSGSLGNGPYDDFENNPIPDGAQLVWSNSTEQIQYPIL